MWPILVLEHWLNSIGLKTQSFPCYACYGNLKGIFNYDNITSKFNTINRISAFSRKRFIFLWTSINIDYSNMEMLLTLLYYFTLYTTYTTLYTTYFINFSLQFLNSKKRIISFIYVNIYKLILPFCRQVLPSHDDSLKNVK